jgi:thioredoxin reductase (NADPH)
MPETSVINTDILIIGAGPTGLFAVFEAGLLKLKCHLIDSLPIPGGQLAEIYPKKPIYDIPGYPEVLAGELVDNLIKQIAPFKPGFTLGERAETLEKLEDGTFKVVTSGGRVHRAPVIAIAGGLGCFEPRKPPIENIEEFETKGVEYMVKDPGQFKGKHLVIAGGGDSALDWTIHLASIAASITLVHRRKGFRGALDSVEKVKELDSSGAISLMTDAQVIGLKGNGQLQEVTVRHKTKGDLQLETDYFIPLFGLSPKLGPLADWGLGVEKNAIPVRTLDYRTSVPGIYAIGDINTYEGKLKLILCGFHEATLMAQSAYDYIYPDRKRSFKYTTVTGITPFGD